MKRTFLIISALIFLSLSIQATENRADALLGQWLTEGGESHVEKLLKTKSQENMGVGLFG